MPGDLQVHWVGLEGFEFFNWANPKKDQLFKRLRPRVAVAFWKGYSGKKNSAQPTFAFLGGASQPVNWGEISQQPESLARIDPVNDAVDSSGLSPTDADFDHTTHMDRGHLIANNMAGPKHAYNLVPLRRGLNSGQWKAFEYAVSSNLSDKGLWLMIVVCLYAARGNDPRVPVQLFGIAYKVTKGNGTNEEAGAIGRALSTSTSVAALPLSAAIACQAAGLKVEKIGHAAMEQSAIALKMPSTGMLPGEHWKAFITKTIGSDNSVRISRLWDLLDRKFEVLMKVLFSISGSNPSHLWKALPSISSHNTKIAPIFNYDVTTSGWWQGELTEFRPSNVNKLIDYLSMNERKKIKGMPKPGYRPYAFLDSPDMQGILAEAGYSQLQVDPEQRLGQESFTKEQKEIVAVCNLYFNRHLLTPIGMTPPGFGTVVNDFQLAFVSDACEKGGGEDEGDLGFGLVVDPEIDHIFPETCPSNGSVGNITFDTLMSQVMGKRIAGPPIFSNCALLSRQYNGGKKNRVISTAEFMLYTT